VVHRHRGLTKRQVCDEIGTDKSVLRRWLAGEVIARKESNSDQPMREVSMVQVELDEIDTDTLFGIFAAFWCKSAPSHEKTAKSVTS
jgi:hypothetical protein